VDPKWGSSVEDTAELVHCMKTVREIMAALDDPQFAGRELEPSASAVTDQQLSQFVRNHVWGMCQLYNLSFFICYFRLILKFLIISATYKFVGHHISSSAPMGTCESPYAVTDGRGLVYGIDALRVVDISVFPSMLFIYLFLYLNIFIFIFLFYFSSLD
jgi:choline dehydrogenase-like flavoprotein